MDFYKKIRLSALLPWGITLALLIAFAFYGIYYQPKHNPFLSQAHKIELISSMRIHLLEAIEAEKNAVLAIDDEESKGYATKALQAADEVENIRKYIVPIIQQDGIQSESELINDFNTCWLQFRKLDESLLNLATQNTNVKAGKISTAYGIQFIQSLEDSINRIIKHIDQSDAITSAYDALTASIKIYALHKSHIEAADDQQMDKIEQDIKAYDEAAKKAFSHLNSVAVLKENLDLKKAETAYVKFIQLTNEVIRLSRMNTNIKSTELSMGKKRLISTQCQVILTTLQNTVQTQGNYSLPRVKKGLW
jgi:hypothetical protein